MTVLIPTHGRPTLLARTLASVSACERPPGYAGCVVIENGPPAGAAPVVATASEACPDAEFRYLHHERANKSAALNAALASLGPEATSPGAQAKGEGHLAVFLDDDTFVRPGALLAYAEAARAHGAGRTFGGPISCDYEQEPPDWLLPLLPASARGVGAEELERMGYFLGPNWAAWVEDLLAAGGFDPAFGPGSPTGARGQESEMQRRLLRGGVRPVFIPEAAATHYVPESRCSPRWAIQRAYYSALGLGGLARHGRSSRNVRASALGIVRHPLRAAVGALRDDTKLRTEALTSLARDVGYLWGFYRPTSRP